MFMPKVHAIYTHSHPTFSPTLYFQVTYFQHPRFQSPTLSFTISTSSPMQLHSPHPSSNPGREDDDHRLMTDAEEGRSIEINNSGAYPTCCIQLSLDGLAVNTVLQSQNINDYEGASGSSISFDCIPQVGVCGGWVGMLGVCESVACLCAHMCMVSAHDIDSYKRALLYKYRSTPFSLSCSIRSHPSSLLLPPLVIPPPSPHHIRRPLRSSWKEVVEQHSLSTMKQRCVPVLSSTSTLVVIPLFHIDTIRHVSTMVYSCDTLDTPLHNTTFPSLVHEKM